jgi:ligand-binding sensor domain-containing protein
MKKFTILLVVYMFLLINHTNSQIWTTYTTANGLYKNTVSTIAIDGKDIWFGYRDNLDGGVSKFDGNNWTTYTDKNGFAGDYVNKIAIDAEGNKWIGCQWIGVIKFDGTTWTTYTPSDSLAEYNVTSIAIDKEGNKWFGSAWVEGRVSKFDGTTWTTYDTVDGLAGIDVWAISIDSSGNKWFGTGDGVSKFDGANWTTYDTTDGLVGNFVNEIAFDAEGNTWFGCGHFWYENGGLTKFDGTNWTSYTTSDGLPCNRVNAIAIDSAGNKWFGCAFYDSEHGQLKGGVLKFDGTTWTTYTTSDGLVSNGVNAIAIDAEGNKWLGTEGGVSKLDEEGIARISVSPENQDVCYMAGNKVFNISINTAKPTNWTISDDADWLTVSPITGQISGTQKKIITASFTADTLTSPRIATIIVSGTGVPSDTVTVTQSGILPDSSPSLYDLKATIYPNPVKDNLFIKINDATLTDITISVVDVSGRSLIKRNFEHIDLDAEKTLDFSFMKSGLYFLEIRSEKNSRVYKIVKE